VASEQRTGASPVVTMIDLEAQYAPLRADIDAAVRRVFDTGRFILGPEVEAFESEIAAMHGVPHGIGVASGTDALMLVWRALKLGPEDEVIVPAMTFLASASSVRLAGAKPAFVDVDPETLNLDPDAVRAAITPRTKAILAVHLYGQCADLTRLEAVAKEAGVPLVEDCAQSIGATWDGRPCGSVGIAGTTSFYPSKNLGAPGEGGMIWTKDDTLAATLRRLRNHGERVRYEHVELGTNSRLMALCGAVLRIKLRALPEWNRIRRENAAFYDAAFAGLEPAVRRLRVDPRGTHVYHQYSLFASERDRLREHLTARGIENIVYYPIPLHLQPCFADLGYRAGQFPIAERGAREVVSIPVHSELTPGKRQRVADAVVEFAKSGAATPAGGR
jgi:UDP-2-acetamido-2-deoxy-ribo-hexuluronate aminotransferase